MDVFGDLYKKIDLEILMTQKLLHISDSWINAQQYDEDETTPLGGLSVAIDRALNETVDAVVHSGNLFERANPKSSLISAVTSELDRLDSNDIDFLATRGSQEVRGSQTKFSTLVDAGYIEHLGASPTTLGDVAIFGIDKVDSRSKLEGELASLSPTESYTSNVVVANQDVWPPSREETADISSLDLLDATDVYLNVVLAGGIDFPGHWESENFDYRVVCSGALNPDLLCDGDQTKTTLLEMGTDMFEYDLRPLTPIYN